MQKIIDFIIVGAGMSGLTLAKELRELGYSLAVFEKARGTGGRLSSKRKTYGDKLTMAFDLGCSSITAKSPDFTRQLEDWHLKGIIAPWWQDPQANTHYVPVPRNSALTRHLSKDIDCRFSTKVSKIRRCDDIWQVFYEVAGGKIQIAQARQLILATPSAQAYELLPESSPVRNYVNSVRTHPQWVMGVKVSLAAEFQANIDYPDSSIIHSISHESAKPDRVVEIGTQVLQIQATPDWTLLNVDADPGYIAQQLMTELERLFEVKLIVECHHVHRWLYSRAAQSIQSKVAEKGYLWDGNNNLGVIGDYLTDDLNGVESAWLSAKNMAVRIANSDPSSINRLESSDE